MICHCLTPQQVFIAILVILALAILIWGLLS